MEEKLNLFRKQMKGEDNSKWFNYFAVNLDGQSITVRLSDTAKMEILKSGIDFPLAVTINDNDYFITTETYTNNDGKKIKSAVCVITSFTKIEKADLEKRTLADVFKEKALKDKGIE